MKKVAIVLGLVFAILAAVGAYVYSVTRPIVLGDITASWASSVRDYAIAHDATLPKTWSEFVAWEKAKDPGYGITSDEMEKRFRILERDLRKGTDSTRYIEIIDPDLKKMEDFVNRTVRSAAYDTPPEKQDAQTVDNQRNVPVLFLGSLPPAGRGWSANKSLQPTATAPAR